MSEDDPDAQVWELHCQGLTIRQIAGRLGVNKGKVHPIIKRLAEALAALEAEADDGGDEDPWDDEDWDDEDDGNDGKEYDPMDELPPRPWIYHGTERVALDMGRGEQPKFERGEVWTDDNGERVNFGLEAYRFRTYTLVAGEHDEASQEAVRAFDADCDRSREAYERRRHGRAS